MDPQTAAYLAADHGGNLITLCSVLIGLSTAAALLRVWSRALLLRNRFQLDDYVALIAWVFVVGFCVLIIVIKHGGFGHHSRAVPLSNLVWQLKLIFAGLLTSLLGLYFTRVSALMFYRRTFQDSSRLFSISLWIGFGLNTVWVVVFSLLTVLGCQPLQKFWVPWIQGTCLSFPASSFASNVSSVVMDLYILLLPVPMVLRLQVKLVKKLMCIGLFFLGYCAVTLSIGRLVSYAIVGERLEDDSTYELVTPVYWSACELAITFLSATVPSILHLLRRLGLHGPSALFHRRDYQTPAQSWISERMNTLRLKTSMSSSGAVRLKSQDAELDDLNASTIRSQVHSTPVSRAENTSRFSWPKEKPRGWHAV